MECLGSLSAISQQMIFCKVELIHVSLLITMQENNENTFCCQAKLDSFNAIKKYKYFDF